VPMHPDRPEAKVLGHHQRSIRPLHSTRRARAHSPRQ
jgi:hypothetical protein